MGRQEWAEVDVDAVTEVREKAIQVDDGDRLLWLPRSTVREWEGLHDSGAGGTIEVLESVAIKKELV